MKRFVWLLIVMMLGVMVISDAYGQFDCFGKKEKRPFPVSENELNSSVKVHDIDNNILNVTIERVYSQNRKFYLKTIKQPGSNRQDYFGETLVFEASNDSIIFRVNGYFDDNVCYDQLYLSNSGQSFCFLSAAPHRNFNVCNQLWFFYSNGEKKIIKLDSLIEPIKFKCETLIYSNPEIRHNNNNSELKYGCNGDTDINPRKRRKFLYKPNTDSTLIIADSYPIFTYNDTLFIISRDLEVLQIDMHNLNITRTSYLDSFDYLNSVMNTGHKEYDKFSYNKLFLTHLKENMGKHFQNKLGMRIVNTRNYEYLYDLNISGYINNEGRFEELSIMCHPTFDKSMIKKLLDSFSYRPYSFPQFLDKWRFSIYYHFRHHDDTIAVAKLKKNKMLKENKFQENANKDTLDGVYIPNDLYEAMEIIDNNISDEDKNQIRKMDVCDYIELRKVDELSIIDKWGIEKGSRIYHYIHNNLMKFGHDMSEYVIYFIKAVYWHYLKDSLFCIPNLNYDKFILNKDINFYVESISRLDTNDIGLNFEKVKTDSIGNKYLFPAFEKSEFINYLHENYLLNYENFLNENINNESKGFLHSLMPYLNENFRIDTKYSGIHPDSALFLEDVYSYELSSLLNDFKFLLTKSDTNSHLQVKSYFVFFNIRKNDIDSLDNIFATMNKENIESAISLYDRGLWDKQNNMIKDYLKNKYSINLHVIMLYPYIKFDFKEYKEKRKRK